MKVQVGDKVIRKSYFQDGFFVLTVVKRNPKTITTSTTDGINFNYAFDKFGRIENYKCYDADKVSQMRILREKIKNLTTELKAIYNSLEDAE